MKIVSWNIQQGGGSGSRAMSKLRCIDNFDADIIVLPEFQLGRAGAILTGSLQQLGYHVSHPPASEGKNTVLIGSRHPIRIARALDSHVPDLRHLWLIETFALRMVGVYMPVGKAKLPYWEAVIRGAMGSETLDLFVGDFNTGTNDLDKAPSGASFVGPQFMERIAAAGFVDLWRCRHPAQREYSWFRGRNKNGFRLDHAFGSSRIYSATTNCVYDHAPRLAAVSDHSALVLEIQSLSI